VGQSIHASELVDSQIQVRLSDLEPRFVCKACGKKGGDIRPNFHWDNPPVAAMGYR
jgi:hypothetical protein